MNIEPDLSKVVEWEAFVKTQKDDLDEIMRLRGDAMDYVRCYDWCISIRETYVGMMYPGVFAVFLLHIETDRVDVDDWVWVIVGDLPPAYLTVDLCPNPATALDGYIGAMEEWVQAAEKGLSVSELIPVNVPANRENAQTLKIRLDFLDREILSEYREDLDA